MNDRPYRHYLITRFNVPVDAWRASRNGDPVLSDEWLSHRFGLFETFCLPSVRNQRNQDFTWLVVLGAETPGAYKDRMTTLAAGYGSLVPLYVGSYGEFLPAIVGEIRQRLTPDVTHVITSRLDNDDSIHTDYISEIQGAFAGQTLAAVDIPEGYNLVIEPTPRIGAVTAPFNPFISLIEDVGGLGTVYSRKHAHWATDAQVVTITEKRLWLTVIHDRNMLNTFRGSPSGSFAGLHAEFGIPQHVVAALSKQDRRHRSLSRAKSALARLARSSKHPSTGARPSAPPGDSPRDS